MVNSGEPIECYILTGTRGAQCIRERIRISDHLSHLQDRIESMLIVLPGKDGSDDEEKVPPLILFTPEIIHPPNIIHPP